MNQRRFVAIAAAIGAAIPLAWLTFYWAYLRGQPGLINSLLSSWNLDRLLIVLWPSWLFLIADPEERSVAIPVAAVLVNVALYAGVGWLIWRGLRESRLLLGLVAVGVVMGWWWLLRWYLGA